MAPLPAINREPVLFNAQYLWITLGFCALVFLGVVALVAAATVAVAPRVTEGLRGK